jgi:hypothetical protein
MAETNGTNGRPHSNGKVSYAEKHKLADHFIGGNRVEDAPASKVKDFVAQNDGHTVITNVSLLLPQLLQFACLFFHVSFLLSLVLLLFCMCCSLDCLLPSEGGQHQQHFFFGEGGEGGETVDFTTLLLVLQPSHPIPSCRISLQRQPIPHPKKDV